MKEKRYVCFFSRLFIDKETDKLVYIDDIANEQDLLIKEEVEQKLVVQGMLTKFAKKCKKLTQENNQLKEKLAQLNKKLKRKSCFLDKYGSFYDKKN